LQRRLDWKKPKQRREFLDEFAKSKKFDPLDAEKWYSIFKKDIINAGGRGILLYYKGSHVRALTQLYPELKLQKQKFPFSRL